jgi:hypothetical protein
METSWKIPTLKISKEIGMAMLRNVLGKQIVRMVYGTFSKSVQWWVVLNILVLLLEKCIHYTLLTLIIGAVYVGQF